MNKARPSDELMYSIIHGGELPYSADSDDEGSITTRGEPSSPPQIPFGGFVHDINSRIPTPLLVGAGGVCVFKALSQADMLFNRWSALALGLAFLVYAKENSD